MKYIALIITLFLIFTQCAPISALVLPSPSATSSADIDPEVIKENIKKRIEQAIKNQNTEVSKKKIAFVGTLTSVTKNSFNLEGSSGGVKQASTSATTIFIDLPRNREIKEGDVSIGDYLAALGFLNEDTKVLDARRILVLPARPELPPRKTTYGLISAIDLKKSTLTIKSPKTGTDITILLTAKTKLSVSNGLPHVMTTSLKDLTIQTPILVIYLPGKTDKEVNTATTVLTYSETISPSPKPSPSPQVSN